MRSDYLRMWFVLAESGLYVDADEVLLGDDWRHIFQDGRLKVQPLCYDMTAFLSYRPPQRKQTLKCLGLGVCFEPSHRGAFRRSYARLWLQWVRMEIPFTVIRCAMELCRVPPDKPRPRRRT